MAKFDIEFDKLILAEGGYVNDSDDAGGETYLGISRKNNPNWSGWKYIDSIKDKYTTNKEFTKILKQDESLTDSVKQLYKTNYWDVLELDVVPSQKIAHEIFDTCVNCGKKRAIIIAQQVCNMTITGEWNEELKYNLMRYGK